MHTLETSLYVNLFSQYLVIYCAINGSKDLLDINLSTETRIFAQHILRKCNQSDNLITYCFKPRNSIYSMNVMFLDSML